MFGEEVLLVGFMVVFFFEEGGMGGFCSFF